MSDYEASPSSDDEIIQCDECDKVLSSNQYLKQHKLYKHGITSEDEEESDEIFQCDKCGKEVSSKHHLKQHKFFKHGEDDTRESDEEEEMDDESDEEEEMDDESDEGVEMGEESDEEESDEERINQKGGLFPLLAAAVPAIIAAAKVAAPAMALSAATGAISGVVNKAVQKGKGKEIMDFHNRTKAFADDMFKQALDKVGEDELDDETELIEKYCQVCEANLCRKIQNLCD